MKREIYTEEDGLVEHVGDTFAEDIGWFVFFCWLLFCLAMAVAWCNGLSPVQLIGLLFVSV